MCLCARAELLGFGAHVTCYGQGWGEERYRAALEGETAQQGKDPMGEGGHQPGRGLDGSLEVWKEALTPWSSALWPCPNVHLLY